MDAFARVVVPRTTPAAPNLLAAMETKSIKSWETEGVNAATFLVASHLDPSVLTSLAPSSRVIALRHRELQLNERLSRCHSVAHWCIPAGAYMTSSTPGTGTLSRGRQDKTRDASGRVQQWDRYTPRYRQERRLDGTPWRPVDRDASGLRGMFSGNASTSSTRHIRVQVREEDDYEDGTEVDEEESAMDESMDISLALP